MNHPNVYIHTHTQAIIDLYQAIVKATNANTTVLSQLQSFSEILWETHKNGNDIAHIQVSNWHPKLVGRPKEVIMNFPFSLKDAQLTIAKEHGFEDWNQVEEKGQQTFNFFFENAIDALLYGQFDELKALLAEHANLLHETSPYGHQATLLHYTGSNGVETRRQIVPSNLPEMTRYLIHLGVNKEATMKVYRGYFNTLQLASTSAHPQDAGIRNDLLAILQTA